MPKNQTSWALIAHGGAKDIAPEEEASNRQGLHEAIAKGSLMLEQGLNAVDVVEEVVKLLELNPAYNAGLYGSVTNADGVIELDASIMDGKTLDIGAVAGIQDILHPVSVAKALLREREIFLVGKGAEKFAQARGFLPHTEAKPIASSSGCDTVGCVARDRHGNLAAATSTGGLEGVHAGRVGDVPLPGCGFYADNMRGAMSASGEGESIARVMLAAEFLRFVEQMHPEEAAKQALQKLNRIHGEAGIISISPDGTIGWDHNSPNFAVGMAQEGKDIKVYLKKSEEA